MVISFEAASGIAYGTNSLSVAMPSGNSGNPGKLLILMVGVRVGTAPPRVSSGWVEIAEGRNVSGTAGAGVGPVRIYAYAKISTGTEGNIVVSLGGGNASWGQTSRWASETGDFYVEAVGASDDVSGTSMEFTFVPPSRLPTDWVKPGDMLVHGYNLPLSTASGVAPAPVVTAPGLTMGTRTVFGDPSTTNGNDLRGRTMRFPVDSGTQTSRNVNIVSTVSAATTGAGILVRISETAPVPNYPGMPFMVDNGGSFNGATNLINYFAPPGAEAGDLLVAQLMVGRSDASAEGAAADGWWVLEDITVGTRRSMTLARIYNPSDSIDVYESPLHASATAGAATSVVAIRDHGVVEASDIVLGTGYSRPSSISTTRAESVTTTQPNSLVLAVFGEATNNLGDGVETTGDFLLAYQKTDSGVVSSSIESSAIYMKDMPTPGNTGLVILDYTATSANGRGLQLIIPPIAPLELPTWIGFNSSRSIYKGVRDIMELYVGTI